jgi:hypothetical protein
MHIDTYTQAVVEDLARVAAVGDESTARAAELLATALEPSIARRLQEALAASALELSARLERGRVELRVAGDDLALVYTGEPETVPAEGSDEALDARITLRLPDSLKSRLEAAAGADGVSVNTWLVRALARQLEPRPSTATGRNRLTGYGRS